MPEIPYVVVTIASNGVVHVWGNKEGQPFPTRSLATSAVQKMKSNDEAQAEFHPGVTVQYKVREILGEQPREKK